MHIRQLRLLTADPLALRPFYAEVLGMPVSTAGSELRVQAGSTELRFAAEPPGLRASYHFAFNIPPHRFEEARRWLRARTPLVAAPDGSETFHFASWNADAIYFNDPAANSLELIARHSLSFDRPGPFGPGHLIAISEIGIACDDVHAAVAAIAQQTGIASYREVSDSFAPLGDEHGLFIVVRRGRLWFNSADRRAELLPVQAEIEWEDRRYAVAVSDGQFSARAL